ncbi:MAG: hypothetical protein IJ003_00765 [Candidatus Gastranaerophilales bacterium]|nr:hypothetical protein [Candidatus Gastranaerophilales bacterium]
MAGFAIWFEGNKNNKNCEYLCDVHFNLWTKSIKRCDTFLDFGIKIPYISELQSICLYLPYVLKKSDIKDLTKIIVSDKRILDSVFNESYIAEEHELSKQYTIKKDGEKQFTMFALDANEETDLNIQNKYDGTVISINLTNKSFIENECYYFRLRFNSKKLNKIVESKSDDLFLNSIGTENNFIDFRLNNWRSLNNSSLKERIQNESIKQYCIKKINFFLMTEGKIDVNSLTKKSERKLENEIWEKYTEKKIDNVIIASQWQDKISENTKVKNIESFNVYAKFKYQLCTPSIIINYILIFAIINVLYSLLYNYLFTNSNLVVHYVKIAILIVMYLICVISIYFYKRLNK